MTNVVYWLVESNLYKLVMLYCMHLYDSTATRRVAKVDNMQLLLQADEESKPREWNGQQGLQLLQNDL